MRKVADHLRGKTRVRVRLFPSHELYYFRTLQTPRNRIFGSARNGISASLFNRTAHQTNFISWIERCRDARKLKHITKFRVDRNVTHSLGAACWSAVKTDQRRHRVNFADSIHRLRWSFPEHTDALLATVAVREIIHVPGNIIT